jgi:hypothetical protein
MSEDAYINRGRAISEIKAALERRSSKSWNVEEGRGTGDILVTTPKEPLNSSMDDLKKFWALFGFPEGVGLKRHQIIFGEIAIKDSEYKEFIARANGRAPSVISDPANREQGARSRTGSDDEFGKLLRRRGRVPSDVRRHRRRSRAIRPNMCLVFERVSNAIGSSRRNRRFLPILVRIRG